MNQISSLWTHLKPLLLSALSILVTCAGAAAATPTQVAPSDGAVNLPVAVTLDWKSLAGADGYDYEVREGNTLVAGYGITYSGGPWRQTSVTLTLDHGRSYRWRVRGRILPQNNPWSGYWTFTTAGLVPPAKISPQNGATDVAWRVTLDWQGVSGASGYDYKVLRGSTVVAENTGGPISGTTITLDLDQNTTYQWQVRARVAPQNNPWSDLWAFTTKQAVPPQQVSPENGAIGLAPSVTLNWHSLGGADGYDFEVLDGNTIVAGYGINYSGGPYRGTEVTLNLERGKTYRWRVRGRVLPQDNPWSPYWSFSTRSPLPAITSAPSAVATVGQPFNYQITATNNPTSFGATGLPAGLSVNTTSGLISGTPTTAGNAIINLSAANSAGSGSATLRLTINSGPSGTLPEALDTTNLTWSTSGGASWFGQSAITHDGSDAAQSGAIGDAAESVLSTQVSGPGTLKFWWKVSCEEDFDELDFSIDDESIDSITGEVGWTEQTVNVPAGQHLLTWTYLKDEELFEGADAGWVDQVRFEPVTSQPPAITSAPSAAATVGQPFSYQITATNDPTSFGATGLPAGLSVNTTSGLISGTPTTAGNATINLSATNSAGSGSATLRLTINSGPSGTLAEALDTTNLTWSTSGGASWFAQSAITHDGADAAQSGAISDTEGSILSTEVTGPGTLKFWWKVSCEEDFDELDFSIDDESIDSITGEVGWTEQTVNVPAGQHLLTWTYLKDEELFEGADAGWVDQVRFEPVTSQPPAITSAPSAVATVGQPFNYQITATNNPTSFGATGLPAGLSVNTTSGLISGTPTTAGNAIINLSAANSAGSGSATLRLTINSGPSGTLPEALDTTNLTWSTSGGASWFGQSAITHDGSDAAQSGAIGDAAESVLSTQVSGPGTLKFWWKVSCEEDFDELDFSIDDESIDSITGEVGWTEQTVNVPAGQHLLTWTYLKDEELFEGADAGWVDQVRFEPVTSQPPAITSAPSAAATVGQPFSYQITATNDPTSFGATGLPAGLSVNTTSGLISGTPTTAGNAIINLSAANSAGSGSATLRLTINSGPSGTLPEALDTTNLTWSTSGGASWFGQSAITHDGSDAAQSGAIGDAAESVLSTQVSGPGTLKFWWKVSCEEDFDELDFSIDDESIDSITGEVGWTEQTVNVPAGQHLLTWTYLKDEELFEGADAGWVDQVRFEPVTSQPPAITSAPSAAATVGQPFSYQITATNDPTSFGATGLPAGLSVNTTSGLISGTPTTAGNAIINLSATNSEGSGSATLRLAITPAFRNGIYSGLLLSEPVSHSSSGYVILALTRRGAFSASLTYGGKKYPMLGKFSIAGKYNGLVSRPGLTSLGVAFAIASDKDAETITGTVDDGYTVALLHADLGAFDGKTNPAPQKGYYSLISHPSGEYEDDPRYPQGYGFGTVVVSKSGVVRLAKRLGDGKSISQATVISQRGTWALYAVAYNGKGSIFGLMRFVETAASDVQGDLTWFKPIRSNAGFYPDGFSVSSHAVGARYATPKVGTRVLPLAISPNNALVTFGGGNIDPIPTPRLVTLDAANKIVASNGDQFTMTIKRKSGLFSGSFYDLAANAHRNFFGMIIQKQNLGLGFFKGNHQTGWVSFTSATASSARADEIDSSLSRHAQR